MKWMVYGAAITLFVLITGLLLPTADGLFFHPEGGFSVGGVHVSVDQYESTVEPGDTAIYNITVANDSDLPVFINATILSISQWKTTLDPNIILLQPHKTANLILCVTAPENADNGTNAKVTIIYAISFPETGENIDVPATTIETVVENGGNSANYIGAAIIVGTSIGLAAFLSTDKGQYLGSLAIAPLYTRIHKDKVLQNEIRNDLFNHIRDNPGESFSEIKRNLELNNGVLAHHLKTLEREHFIKSRKDGLYRRFFLRNQPVPHIILNGPQKEILGYLVSHPGVPQSKVAFHLGVSRQTANYHILAMEKMGAIQITRHGRRTLCYPLIRAGPSRDN